MEKGEFKILQNKTEKTDKVTQEQLYDLLVSRELSWQEIIHDLIKTEQLDPWDIDLVLLARKFLERIIRLQGQENVFFISSKVLLAAAILLRMKSEILRDNIKDIDEILFEDKEKQKMEIAKPLQLITQELGIMNLDEDVLVPKTPLPRARKVTLNELMQALERAINTEHRRIKRRLVLTRARRELEYILPRPLLNIPQKIRELWGRLKNIFYKEKKEKIMFSQLLSSSSREEKIATFLPLVFLDHQKRVWLEQAKPFEDIEIWMKRPQKETINT
ncbi:MAG: segregation/condensation protein A [Candidatus Pacearchaeota archaeon]